VFTLEELASGDTDFRIETHGRYSHSQTYVERVLRGAGFSPEIAHADLRTESALPVAGLVVRATKVNGQDDASHV
jgi:predicted TPR repeat methyltransferase